MTNFAVGAGALIRSAAALTWRLARQITLWLLRHQKSSFRIALSVVLALNFSAAVSSAQPNLSGLSSDERQSIESVCSSSKAAYGPAAYYECLQKQIASLSSGPRAPNLSGLSSDERQSIESVCSSSKAAYGPAAYYECLQKQIASLSSGPRAPRQSRLISDEHEAISEPHTLDLSILSTDEREAIDFACRKAKMHGTHRIRPVSPKSACHHFQCSARA